MTWFIKTSYSYINPEGFLGHLNFFVALPNAYWKYRKAMKDG